MARIVIVGDGPGGLSAALFLAKRGENVTVFGNEESSLHYAFLYNYLGIPAMSGTQFQATAKEQVQRFGAVLVDAEVESVERTDAGFMAFAGSARYEADYLLLAEGRVPRLARSLGVDETDDGIVTDPSGATSVDRVFVVGRAVRPISSQAIISAGDGARAALAVLEAVHGYEIQDWDRP